MVRPQVALDGLVDLGREDAGKRLVGFGATTMGGRLGTACASLWSRLAGGRKIRRTSIEPASAAAAG